MRTPALLVFVGAAILFSAGCQTLAPGYTLSPAVRNGAEQYGDVMADFTNQALLENVLRARDFVPLNFNDLSAITGAFSMSGTAGFTLPFGPDRISGTAMTGASGYKYSVAPSITGSASPVLTLGTLNTQGFILSMLQPVSTSYILSKWDAHDHELLLRLFVKSIRFSDKGDIEADGKLPQCQPDHARAIYLNDPDNECEFLAFQNMLSALVSENEAGGQVDMKSLMVLDPLGRPVPAGKTVATTIPPPDAGKSDPGKGLKDTQYAVSYDATIFQTINGLADGQLHAGNAKCPNDVTTGKDNQKLCESTDNTAFVQFYKEYPAQVVLCLNPDLKAQADPKDNGKLKVKFHGHLIYSVDDSVKTDHEVVAATTAVATAQASKADNKTELVERAQKQLSRAIDDAAVKFATVKGADMIKTLSLTSKPPGGATPAPGGSSPNASVSGGAAPGAGGGAAAPGASGQVTLALQPGRVSAIVPGASCDSDQIVLNPETEKTFSDSDRHFIHVEWRSVSEVIQYLGAITRHEDPTNSGVLPPQSMIGAGDDATVLFSYQTGDKGPVAANYRGHDYSIPAFTEGKPPVSNKSDAQAARTCAENEHVAIVAPPVSEVDKPKPRPFVANHSLEVMSMLNELVGVSKVSGSLPVSQPVQVLPP